MKKLLVIFIEIFIFFNSYNKIKAENFKPYLNYSLGIMSTVGNRENENQEYLVFTGATDNSKTKEVKIDGKYHQITLDDEMGKVVSIYSKNGKLYYVYGEEGRPEIQIEGIPGKNLFKNYGVGPLLDFGGRAQMVYIAFENKNYMYVIERITDGTKMPDEYYLSVYKDKKEEPIFNKKIRLETITDELLDTYESQYSEIPEIPSDDRRFYWFSAF